MPEFLENPSFQNLLEALSGQHRDSMCFTLVSDKDIPKKALAAKFWGRSLHQFLSGDASKVKANTGLIMRCLYDCMTQMYQIGALAF